MDKKKINDMFLIVFIGYVLFVVGIVLFKFQSPINVFINARYSPRLMNLIPFDGGVIGHINEIDIVNNIVLFIPFGIYLNSVRHGENKLASVIDMFCVSCVLEMLQYILAIGIFDTTDIITNTFGGFIGIMIFQFINHIINDEYKMKKFISIFSIAILVPSAGASVLQMI